MLARKMPLAAAARFVLPDDLIDKIAIAEDLVQKDLYIMYAVPIQMHPDSPLVSEQIPHIKQPHTQHAQITFHTAFPDILIRPMADPPAAFRLRKLRRAGLRRLRDRDLGDRVVVRFTEKRRIDIDLLHFALQFPLREQVFHKPRVIGTGQRPAAAGSLESGSLQTLDRPEGSGFSLFIFHAALLDDLGKMTDQTHAPSFLS